MQFKLNGQVVVVGYEYQTFEGGLAVHDGKLEPIAHVGRHFLSEADWVKTTCFIKRRLTDAIEANGNNPAVKATYEVLATGVSFKIPEDALDKGKGRRASLSNALATAQPLLFSKADRKEIWKQYAANHADRVSKNIATSASKPAARLVGKH